MRWKSSKLPAMMGIGKERTSTPGEQLIEDADDNDGVADGDGDAALLLLRALSRSQYSHEQSSFAKL